MRRSLWGAGVAIALSLMPFVPAASAGGVQVPAGFWLFCAKNPGECQGGGASSIALTDELMALLEDVNASINRAIRPNKHDPKDVWMIGVKEGDCEEYVLAKRRSLIRNGVPASALSIVYALRNGGGHAILAVHTDQGSFALDNMSKRIKPLYRTGYRIISMSGPNPKVWHRA